MKTVKLLNGVEMPMLGLGLSHNGGYSSDAVVAVTVEQGIRLFDTAARYGNEQQVKCTFQVSQSCKSRPHAFPQLSEDVLKKAGLEREEVFITTKL